MSVPDYTYLDVNEKVVDILLYSERFRWEIKN